MLLFIWENTQSDTTQFLNKVKIAQGGSKRFLMNRYWQSRSRVFLNITFWTLSSRFIASTKIDFIWSCRCGSDWRGNNLFGVLNEDGYRRIRLEIARFVKGSGEVDLSTVHLLLSLLKEFVMSRGDSNVGSLRSSVVLSLGDSSVPKLFITLELLVVFFYVESLSSWA